MHASQITLDKAKEERRKLSRMYDEFFGGLAKLVRESSQKQEIRGRENLSK
jgi:N6-adenosine-specific RNA methylase IME4